MAAVFSFMIDIDDAKPITREELTRRWKNARFKAARRWDFEELGGVFVIIR
jgi:hypothetical protein